LRNVSGSVPNVDSMTPAELCAMDPVNVSLHFKKKWDAIFTKLIKAKDNPNFGEVVDHFWRIEYQSRGAPHVHCVLWIRDAPILGKDSIDDVKIYVQKVITCAKPDANTSPSVSDLASRFQTHKCNKYCTKTYKHNGKFFKKCRFGFPRPVRSNFQMNDVVDCLAVSKNKQPRKRLYHLPRSQDEQYINDYNAALLLANQANVDVQYIGHLGSRLPYYITDYMTKREKSEQDEMWQDIFTSTKSLGTNAMSLLLKSVKNRQVGANEAADRLLGHKLYSMSRQTRFADLQPSNKAKRVLKTATEIEQLLKHDPQSEDIFKAHWVLDVYPDRPDDLETCSLHEFLGWFERIVSTGINQQKLKLKTLNFYLRRRRAKPYIVTHQTVNPHQTDESREQYYYYLLKLFKPWRNESKLSSPGKSYFETFLLEKDSLPEMVAYHERNVTISEQDREMENAVRERAKEVLEQEPVADDIEGALQSCIIDHMQTAMQDLHESHARMLAHCNDDELLVDYQQLNVDQRRVVDNVVTQVCSTQTAIRLLVSGQGGTGKSRVIDVLSRLVTKQCGAPSSVPVVVCAPTGLAAFKCWRNNSAQGPQSTVEHGKPADYSPLGQKQLTTLRATLKGLKLLIVDEVSMVSSLTLLFIHLRLTEVMNSDTLFGGISIVFFADLLQLPPVKGNQPFIPVTFLEAEQRLGAIASVDLWQTFIYDELTINMRQSGDKEYSDLLSNVRVGQITDDHFYCWCNV